MIYLASTSPRRKKLLKQYGIVFKTIRPDYHEKNGPKDPPSITVKKHALAKAVSCVSRVKEGVILGSDTIVYFRGNIIGKPKNFSDAINILSDLQARWHVVYTGVAVLTIKDRKIIKKKTFVEKTKVHLKKMDRPEILRYLKKIKPLDKAGSYAIQSKNTGIITQVQGLLSNAIGLPIERLERYL